MKRGTRRAIVWSVIAIAVIAVTVLLAGRKKAMQKVEYETARVERTDIAYYVTATGTIEPVTEVQVGTQVSGIIASLYADYNSTVRQGQVIAEMDKVTLESDLASARATYDGNQAEYVYQDGWYYRAEIALLNFRDKSFEYEFLTPMLTVDAEDYSLGYGIRIMEFTYFM